MVWDSAAPAHVRASRAAWRARPLHELFRWSQTGGEVDMWLLLPGGTAAREVSVEVRVATRATRFEGLATTVKWLCYEHVRHRPFCSVMQV